LIIIQVRPTGLRGLAQSEPYQPNSGPPKMLTGAP